MVLAQSAKMEIVGTDGRRSVLVMHSAGKMQIPVKTNSDRTAMYIFF